MNDNLRYISLQYIKGNNYDKVTCFSFNNEQFKNFLDTNKDANEKDLFYSLEETKKSKCEIGERVYDRRLFCPWRGNKTGVQRGDNQLCR